MSALPSAQLIGPTATLHEGIFHECLIAHMLTGTHCTMAVSICSAHLL